MNRHFFIKFALIIISIILFNSCSKKTNEHKVRYYIYDYYEANWLLVRNAMIIKEIVINDSISCIQITDHNHTIEKEYGIKVVYDRKLFQKTTWRGIYFSEDSINYVLHFDFLSAVPRKMNFQIYAFYNIKDGGMKLDTIRDYLKERGNVTTNERGELEYKTYYYPEQCYHDYYNYRTSDDYYFTQMLFMKGCSFPLFCDIGSDYYYVLSGAIGFSDALKFLEEAQQAVHNQYLILFGGASKIIPEPSRWTHARFIAMYKYNVQELYKKRYTIRQIADSLNSTEDAVRNVLETD